MSDEVKPKMWLFRGEVRAPKAGEWVIAREYPSDKTPWLIRDEHHWCDEKVPILEHISPDTVMVPREKFERLQRWLRGERIDLPDLTKEILACDKPAEPKDEILQALIRACTLETPGSPQMYQAARAVSAREAELKARKP